MLYVIWLVVIVALMQGDVSFRENGDRPGKISFFQYRSQYLFENWRYYVTVTAGDYNGSGLTKVQYASLVNEKFMYDDGESRSTVFPG